MYINLDCLWSKEEGLEVVYVEWFIKHRCIESRGRVRNSYRRRGAFMPRWMSMTSYHYNDVIMSAMASQIPSLTIVYSTIYSGADQRKHQSSASLVFVRRIHRWPVKRPVTQKMFSFDDVIMTHSTSRASFTNRDWINRHRNEGMDK